MAYATQDDMTARFGMREVVALTDRSLHGVIDAAVLQAALVDASAEIDGYLAARYAVPLAGPPRIICGYCCDIARYRLCGGATLHAELIRERYRDAIRFLTLAAAGKVTLGGMPDGGVGAMDKAVQWRVGRRVFVCNAEGF
ncbi:gp436 family protein [Aquitalea aquatica]|uniref:DUF1320 domain-containing protein n=1 Tax=Aquitalea aquatica TaxID=3044273 RepID=A0A838Y2A9_9NEIS|nr:DUF1320 domain-containing protein [Aquitalea magnusonii]MBA4709570.1 DUF1320 domain-containing protein [Aquitalea magnusonii]